MENRITKEGLEKLKKELEDLKTVKRKEIAERLKHAISFGDLSENAAYSEAKEAQIFLEHRISELEQLIKKVVVFEAVKSDKIQIGSVVTIEEVAGDKTTSEEKYTVVGATEADPLRGKVSPESPLGRAMISRRAGDSFTFNAPGGKIKYKVLKIE
jgi:transcription elongation factor GreA